MNLNPTIRYTKSPRPEEYRNNLPSESGEGAAVGKLWAAMDKVEAQIKNGEPVSAPHPYGPDISASEITEIQESLRSESGWISSSWEKFGPNSSAGELSIRQVSSVLKGESADLLSEVETQSRQHDALQESSRTEAAQKARREFRKGLGSLAATTGLMTIFTAAGAAAGAIVGPIGLLLGGTIMAGQSMKIAFDSDFGREHFKEAKSLRRYAAEEKVPASQSPTIISLKEREKMLESLAGYADGWAEVLESQEKSRSLGWLFGSRERKSPS